MKSFEKITWSQLDNSKLGFLFLPGYSSAKEQSLVRESPLVAREGGNQERGGGGLDCCWTQQEAGSMRLKPSSFLKKPIKFWKRWGVWPNEEPAARLAQCRDKKTTFEEVKMCWPYMNVGASQVWRKETAEIEQFHSYKQKSLSLFWVKTSDKRRLAIFTLPTTTERSTVHQWRGHICPEWLCVCLLWESIFWEPKWLKSGSLEVSPPPKPPPDSS